MREENRGFKETKNTCGMKRERGYWLGQKGTNKRGRLGWGGRESPNTIYKGAGRQPATLYPN